MRDRKSMVKNFVKQIYGKKVRISYRKSSASGLRNDKPMEVLIGYRKLLRIYEPWLMSKKTPITDIQAFLLHEIGHLTTAKNKDIKKDTSYQEFIAQKWAINKARELNMRSTELYLILMMALQKYVTLWVSFLGPWVCLVVNRRQTLKIEVGINLRGGNVGVAKQFLHCTQIATTLQHVAGEGMAQHVWMYMCIQS